jgi:hypothetical protein
MHAAVQFRSILAVSAANMQCGGFSLTAHNTQPDDESLMISPADQRLLFARLYKPHSLLHVGLATGGISDTLSKDQVLKGAGARSRHCCANSARTVEEPARSA